MYFLFFSRLKHRDSRFFRLNAHRRRHKLKPPAGRTVRLGYCGNQITARASQRRFKERHGYAGSSKKNSPNPFHLFPEADFVYLKAQTGATSGNLSVQIDKLQQAGYIEVSKGFKGKMPQTLCQITDTGREAFAAYVNALRSYIK